MRRLYHCYLPLHYETLWAEHTSCGLFTDTAFLSSATLLCVCMCVHLSLAVSLSAVLTACHPHWDSSEQIFTLINTDSSLDVSLYRSKVKINWHSHLRRRHQGVSCVWGFFFVCECVTCYSPREAVGGRRWWWERSCATGHRRGGRERTRSAACLWSGSGSGFPLSPRCSPAQSNCGRRVEVKGQRCSPPCMMSLLKVKTHWDSR